MSKKDIAEELKRHLSEVPLDPSYINECLLFIYFSKHVYYAKGRKDVNDLSFPDQIVLIKNIQEFVNLQLLGKDCEKYLIFGIDEFRNDYPNAGLDEFENDDSVLYSPIRSLKILEYLIFYLNNPYIELLCKAGFAKIIASFFDELAIYDLTLRVLKNFASRFKSGSDIQKITGLKKHHWKLLIKYLNNYEEYCMFAKFLKIYDLSNERLEKLLLMMADEFKEYYEIFFFESFLDLKTADGKNYYTFDSLLGYLENLREKQGFSTREGLSVLWDYMIMCRELNCEPKIKSANLETDHNVIKILYEEHKKEYLNNIQNALKKRKKKLEHFVYGNDRLQVVVPGTVEDLFNEGKNNSNCVASYTEKHALGRTNIFFVRKKQDLNKSYITVEMNNNKQIVQAFYSHNRKVDDPNDLCFLEEWKKIIGNKGAN